MQNKRNKSTSVYVFSTQFRFDSCLQESAGEKDTRMLGEHSHSTQKSSKSASNPQPSFRWQQSYCLPWCLNLRWNSPFIIVTLVVFFQALAGKKHPTFGLVKCFKWPQNQVKHFIRILECYKVLLKLVRQVPHQGCEAQRCAFGSLHCPLARWGRCRWPQDTVQRLADNLRIKILHLNCKISSKSIKLDWM